jgi:hypothetical protein
MDGIAHGKARNILLSRSLDIANTAKMPFAPSEYQFFRNVKDFGAVGDGVTDDTAAINRAVVAMSSSNLTPARCGETCASTSTLGALVYFPVCESDDIVVLVVHDTNTLFSLVHT